MTGSPTGARWRRARRSATRDTQILNPPDLYPNPGPGLVEPPPDGRPAAFAEDRDREQRRWDRDRTIRVACTIITAVCGLFAVVLVAEIIMVIGSANPANGVAAFVAGWSNGISLGFDNLFTPANAIVRVLLNDGLAALVWLGFGTVVTTLIRRLVLPGPDRIG